MSGTTTQPPPDDAQATVDQMLAQLRQSQQQRYAPPAPVDRSTASLLGEALGGGTSGLAPAERETAGGRALLNFGLNMLANSGYTTGPPRTFGQIFAQGASGAQQSLAGSEAVGAARLGAQQAYEENQQKLQLEKIKTAIPLLTLQTQMQQAAAARKLAGTGAPGTSIATAGNYEGDIATLEGSGKSATSTAAGVGQFIEPTWNSFVAANPELFKGMTPEQILAARDKPEIANKAITWLAQQNAPALAKAGVAPSGPSLALAHRLGPAAAAAVMQAPDNAPVADVLVASIGKDKAAEFITANSDLGTATAGDLKKKYAGVHAPGFLAPPAASGAPAAPAPAPTATAPAARPGAPAQAPTAPPVVTDQPASPGFAGPGAPSTARVAAVNPAAQTDADIIAKGMVGAGADPATLAPPRAPPAPVQVAGPGAPPAPALLGTPAAETQGLVMPPGATPPPPPGNPDIKSGDVTVSHPGAFADYFARERAPTPTTEDFNPNLSAAQQAAFAAKAKGISDRAAALEQQAKGVGTLDFKDQPKAVADIQEKRGALAAERETLAAEQQNAAQTKAQAAATAQTKFDTEQREAVQKRYDAALAHYREVAKGQITFNQDIIKSQATKRDEANQKLLEPYQNGAQQAQSLLPNIDLARQIEQSLPEGASPWLNKAENREKLARYEQFLPKNWSEALQGADLFSQIMEGMVTQMGANLVSGQPGGRQAAYEQFRTMLPSLAQSKTGRELALTFVQELAQRRIAEHEFMQNYSWDPKNRDPELHVPNMSGALTAMNKPGALPPMLKLPPVSYDPNLPPTDQRAFDNRKRYNDYYRSVQPGGRYITYATDEKGLAHPVAKTKRQPVPDPTDPSGTRLIDQPPEGGED